MSLPIVGSIVTVILDCIYCGEQGEVVEIINDGDLDGPICVRFGEQSFVVEDIGKTSLTVRFREEDLHQDEEWNPSAEASEDDLAIVPR